MAGKSPIEDSISKREINRLALPAILTGIAEPVITLVDTAFVGQIGTTELAAVGIAGSFYLMTVWILAQTLTAIAAIVSRYYGSKRLTEIETLVPQALVSNILLGVGFLVLTKTFSEDIFRFYNADGPVLELCKDYFSIRSWGFPFTLATLLLFGVFRGLQNTSWAMIISLSGATVNLILDYILIFGIDGMVNPMGIEGAAAASLVSQILMFLMALVFLYYKTPFRLKIQLKLNAEYRNLAGMSIDLFIRTILLNLTFYLATRYATGYGEEVIAAHTIAINIWLFSSFFIDGYAHAGNALAGRLLGEERPKLLYKMGLRINRIAIWIGFGLAVIYGIGYFQIGKFFSNDAAVLAQFEAIFFLVIITQPINASAFAFDGIYKGLGEMKLLRNLLIFSTLFGFVPVSVSFHYYSPGLLGIWIAFLVWMVIRSGWLVFDFRKRYGRS
ncbi:MATE family efflux transporter [Cryomorphaceae bacterium 1068]|nr:MATE family efflux transporter [Cryomorphaceae bacterium 1068]